MVTNAHKQNETQRCEMTPSGQAATTMQRGLAPLDYSELRVRHQQDLVLTWVHREFPQHLAGRPLERKHRATLWDPASTEHWTSTRLGVAPTHPLHYAKQLFKGNNLLQKPS